MTLKQVARHRAIIDATPDSAQRAAVANPQHRAGLSSALTTGLLALAVLLAVVAVVLGMAVR